jgi:serine protease AprX
MYRNFGPIALRHAVNGVRWRICAAVLVTLAGLAAIVPAAQAATAHVRVVVTGTPGSGQAAAAAVRHADGRVIGRVAIINGVVARVPVRSLNGIRRSAGVRSVRADRSYELSDASTDGSEAGVTLAEIRAAVGVGDARLGAGVDVALIDSGIAPVPGLDDPQKVVTGPDLSADADDESLRHLDAFGHGTHLAGLIAADGAGYTGVAPASRLVNVKVADRDGETSLSRLLMAVDWVVRNRSRDGMNIRVMNLAFGAPTDGSYRDDPMAFAVEQAWRRGIVVVAAAGNGGSDSTALDSPAVDPYVVAVGGQDMLGTVVSDDDVVADFSSRGSVERSPDVIAPAVGLISLRVPSGHLDELFPQARVGEAGFRGSGTSQSAAVASGAIAALLGQRPDLTPDETKAVLRASARPIAGADVTLQGAGVIDAGAAVTASAADASQKFAKAHGGGPWRGRGGLGLELAVEHPDASRWSASRWSASRWSASRWSASRWSASRWSASRWSASRWSASRWSAAEWGAGE